MDSPVNNPAADALAEVKALLASLVSSVERQKESSDALAARFNSHEENVTTQLATLASAQTEMEVRLGARRNPPPPLTTTDLPGGDPTGAGGSASRNQPGPQGFILGGNNSDPPENSQGGGGSIPPGGNGVLDTPGSARGTTNNTGELPPGQGAGDYESLRRSIDKTHAELLAMTSKVHRASSAAPEIDRVIAETERTPFTPRIAEARIRETGKLRLPLYEGKSDPKAHMTAFRIAVTRAHFSEEEKDAGYCRLFVENLTGSALEWFSQLESGSIDSFTQLSVAFVKHYSIFMEKGASDADLWTVTQGPVEPLRKFIERFKAVKAKVAGVSESTALAALKHGLWHESPFRFDLTIHKPDTIEDALHRSTNWIAAEEEKVALSKKFKNPTKSSDTGFTPRKFEKKDNKEVRSGGGGSHSYNVEKGRKKVPVRDGSRMMGRNPDAYCELHKCNGHATHECFKLKNFISKKLAQDGLAGANIDLEEVRREMEAVESRDQEPAPKRNRSPERAEASKSSQKKRIDFIMGGSRHCRDSVRSIKSHVRRADFGKTRFTPAPSCEITFTESDATRLDLPHDDVLVVQVDIGANCEVSRVLIDTGSTVDVLFLETLVRMGIEKSEVRGPPTPLTGFSGTTEMSLGTVRLPVSACGVLKMIDFTVVDRPAAYNAILGTPWLHEMRAVPSTFHQCVKFPTSNGVGTLYGNQKNSRMCYLTGLKNRVQ